MLGTRVTMKSPIIQRRFKDMGVAIEVPSAERQADVLALIARLQRENTSGGRDEIVKLSGGRSVILGCTELTLAFPEKIGEMVFRYKDTLCVNALAIHVNAILDAVA